jgi:hypothetical protein
MRKLTTIAALVLALSLAIPSVTFAATPQSPKTKSSTVREDEGPRQDFLARVWKYIKSHLPIGSNDDASPIIPTP